MSKDLSVNTYLDFYESLLTEKQQEVMNMYYREDYSLSEIAENMEISRAAVNDLIKRVNKIIKGYEDKLHLAAKFEKRNQLYEELLTLKEEKIKVIVAALQEIE